MSTVFLFQRLKWSVPVKKEEDICLHIKEENLRDGHSREARGETDREDHSTGDSSKEVRKAEYLHGSSWSFG